MGNTRLKTFFSAMNAFPNWWSQQRRHLVPKFTMQVAPPNCQIFNYWDLAPSRSVVPLAMFIPILGFTCQQAWVQPESRHSWSPSLLPSPCPGRSAPSKHSWTRFVKRQTVWIVQNWTWLPGAGQRHLWCQCWPSLSIAIPDLRCLYRPPVNIRKV